MADWSKNYDRCKLCGSTKYPHHARGLCTACHAEVLGRGHGEELLTCNACHDAHQQVGTGLLADTTTASCRECHDEVAAGKTVHPALEDGCEACHDPHSEENVAQARASCLECHEMGGDEELSSLHGNLSLKPAVCAVCHPPHASGYEKPELARGFSA